MISQEVIEQVIKQLERNNFEVFLAENTLAAKQVFETRIIPGLEFASASYGDSMTMQATNVLDLLKTMPGIEFIDTFNPNDTRKEQIQNRKRALTADLFLTGTNAITMNGQLVNLDMVGNRVAPVIFGPRNVVLFVGTNKLVENLDEAFKRIKTIAPQNVRRHEQLKTPCQVTGVCHDCRSPQRICNSWTIIEKSYPPKRIKIILINQELGL
jgi:hypothetical protein